MIYKNDNYKKNNKIQELLTAKCEEDVQPNAYTISCIKWIIPIITIVILLYLFFKYLSNFYDLALPDFDVTLIGLLGSAFLILVAYLIGIFVDHSNPWLKYIFIFAATTVVTLISILMSYIVILTAFAPLLIAAQYSNKNVIKFAYILSILSSFFIVICSYKFGLCDANMVIMPASKISVYGKTLSAAIRPLSESFWSLIILFVLPRFILLTAFVPLINAIVNNRKETIKREVEFQFKGEHDLLTGFYNRNKYSSMIKDSYGKLKNVAILFFDINNLKYTNDTFGHDVGDNLITRAADSIRYSLNDNMDAYRLGGDEFMVVITDGNENDAEAFIEEWGINLNIVNSLPAPVECSIAYGIAVGEGKDFNEIVKKADIKMYEDKIKIKSQEKC